MVQNTRRSVEGPLRVRELMSERGSQPGIGGRVGLERVRVAYQNVGGGVAATHEFLEFCREEQVGVVFVGECRIERQGGSTQTHPGYDTVGRVSKDSRVVAHVRRDLVGACRLVVSDTRFVCLQVGDYRFGGVYGRCGSTVDKMRTWLEGVGSSLRDCRWVVLGDWNAASAKRPFWIFWLIWLISHIIHVSQKFQTEDSNPYERYYGF